MVVRVRASASPLSHPAAHCNRLSHTATHCNTLQRTATHCNTLQQTATGVNIPWWYAYVLVHALEKGELDICVPQHWRRVRIRPPSNPVTHTSGTYSKCVAVCCSVLQCVAVFCEYLNMYREYASLGWWEVEFAGKRCEYVCCNTLQHTLVNDVSMYLRI